VPLQPAALELLTALAPVLARWGRWYVFGAQAVIICGPGGVTDTACECLADILALDLSQSRRIADEPNGASASRRLDDSGHLPYHRLAIR
jgi:hypothetical protein